MTDPKRIQSIIADALAIEAEDAQRAGKVGFMARAMVQATMPHRSIPGHVHQRVNGDYRFTMLSNPEYGLPFGSLPRLLLSWIATEAVRTKERDLMLGDSMSAFMRELGYAVTGGKEGSITRLKNQTQRLFSSSIQCSYSTVDGASGQWVAQNMVIADTANLWWHPKSADQRSLFGSTVRLSEQFYNEIVSNPVPVDIRALQALKRSPLALDIYAWLTYRMSYLSAPTEVRWESLQAQFGANYAASAQGTRDFKKRFLAQLKAVQAIYPTRAAEGLNGLLLKPSRPHIRKAKPTA